MPDYGQQLFKHLSNYSNILYKEDGVIKCRNNKTGVVTYNTYIDPLINTILASGDPSFEVEAEVYNLSPSFSGFNVTKDMQAKLNNLTQFWVPSGYTGAVWKYHPTDGVIYYAKLDGGYYDEQDPQSNLWDCVSIKPVSTNPPTTVGAVYACEWRNMKIWRCKRPIYINTNDKSWANQNYFEHIYSEACVYLGAVFEHTGTYTINQSGTDKNIFIDVSGQGTVVDGTNHFPDVLGGFIDVFGQDNIFIDCNPWDLYQVPAAISMNITVNGKGTQIIGGMATHQNFEDAGTRTRVWDSFQGFHNKTRTNCYGTENSWDFALNVSKHATTASYEQIAMFSTTASTDILSIENQSEAVGCFAPVLRSSYTSANSENWMEAIHVQGLIKNANDTADNVWACGILAARLQNTPFLVVNRPLWSIRNYSTDKYRFYTDRLDMLGNKLINAVQTDVKTGYLLVNTTPVTLTAASESLVKVDASGGARTINLPAVANNSGLLYTIIKSDSSANAVTIDGASAETINGATTLVLTKQYQSVVLRCDGAAWFSNPAVNEKVGKATANGTGSATSFTIAHGLGVTPTYAFVDCSSHAISRTWTVDGTNITVVFAVAPNSGTNNVIMYWRVIA